VAFFINFFTFPLGSSSPARQVLNVVGVACVLGLVGNLLPLPNAALQREPLADGFRGRSLLSTPDAETSGIQVRRPDVITATGHCGCVC